MALEHAIRARSAWDDLVRSCVRPALRAPVVHEPGRLPSVDVWPFSQVMHAAALLAEVDSCSRSTAWLPGVLRRYRRGAAYSASAHGRRRFFDDNAWVALAARELGRAGAPWLGTARGLLPFLREGLVDAGDDGVGCRWVEDEPGINACSTGSAGLVALRLAAVERPGPGRDALVRLGVATSTFLARRLTDDDGLVADRLLPDGSQEPTRWAYNQGLAIGLDVARVALGEADRLVPARAMAARTLDWLEQDDRMWRQPPCFVAILCRELLALHAHDGDGRWRRAVVAYADRVWSEGRTHDRRLVGGGGIGRYDEGSVLDHAAVVQLWALLARDG